MTSTHSKFFWPAIWIVFAGLLLLSALTKAPSDVERTIFSDQSAHIMATMSIWHDQDLKYEISDLARFELKFPSAGGPRGMFLKTNNDRVFYFAKPILYATIAAPFYGIFGTDGFIILNSFLVIIIGILTFKAVYRVFDPTHAHILALVFVGLSPFAAWIPVVHPDLFIAVLLFSAGYIVLSGHRSVALVAGGLVFGLSIYEKLTFLAILPFLVAAAYQVSPRQKLYIGLSVLAGWFLPTIVNLLQDGQLLSYQGIRFRVDGAPFPLQKGWNMPMAAAPMTHIFDVWNVITALAANLALLPQKLGDFVVGRQTGLLLYFPLALFFLAVALYSRSKRSYIVLAGFSAYVVLNWLGFPSNGFGGRDSYGSRYLMQVLPLLPLALLVSERAYPAASRERLSLLVLGYAFIGATVLFQVKTWPVTEALVRTPSDFLLSYPAKAFPLEKSLLPSIPIHGYGFLEYSTTNGNLQVFRSDVTKDVPVCSSDRHVSLHHVIYRRGVADMPHLRIDAARAADVRLLSGSRLLWEGKASPSAPVMIALDPSIFDGPYFDLLPNDIVSWASLKSEVTHVDDGIGSVCNVRLSFEEQKAADTTVPLSVAITAGELTKSGIERRFHWSNVESWGVWSNGRYAELLIRLPEIAERTLKMTVKARGFVAPNHPTQVVIVHVNGRPVTQWIFNGSREQTKSLLIDRSRFSTGLLSIGFLMPNAASPAALGLSADSRLLGIGLVGLEIDVMDDETSSLSE